jgi:eukaryotic-like serine/threonine-protein kinase
MTSFVWVDRKGVRRFLGLPENLYEGYDLSPDGKHLAVTQIGKAPEREIGIWIYNLLQGSGTRLTPLGTGHRAVDVFPRWAPDSRHVVHDRYQAPRHSLHWAPIDPCEEALDLWVSGPTGPQWLYPMSFSPDGSVLSAFGPSEGSGHDIWLMRLGGGKRPLPGRPELFLGNPFSECHGQISPDGHWMVYSSNQSGSSEIYVTSYPKPGRVQQISNGGGRKPIWNPAAPEIVYLKGRQVYAADVSLGPDFRAGEPRLLFEGPFPDVEGFGFDITADGQRFLMLENRDFLEPAVNLTVITNFFDELRRRAPSQ